MAQLTIYLDDATRSRIEAAAAQAETSVSKWVKHALEDALERKWPPRYFELFGALAGVDLDRPEELRLDADARRERFSK